MTTPWQIQIVATYARHFDDAVRDMIREGLGDALGTASNKQDPADKHRDSTGLVLGVTAQALETVLRLLTLCAAHCAGTAPDTPGPIASVEDLTDALGFAEWTLDRVQGANGGGDYNHEQLASIPRNVVTSDDIGAIRTMMKYLSHAAQDRVLPRDVVNALDDIKIWSAKQLPAL
ncbi:hypothetical protein ACFQ1S_06930 [Kibdelosporangium lantanae]|uniref:Uncharacterized protein n=1 Tax=Kibdelosporangium lantanae TaxID=1497396 RepID=A0ABW3M5Y1_9PSEU